MPWQSKKQQRWGHSPAGKKELSKKEIKEFDDATDFDSLKDEATGGKGPTRRQGSGQKTPESVKNLRRSSREIHKDVNQNSAGPQTSKKGDRGYNRKQKHKNSDDETISEELTMVDETYRGVGFPMAETLSWKTSARRGSGTSSAGDDDETPVVDTPGFPPTKEGGGDVPDDGAAWGSSIAADLTWSTHKSETFNDDGEKGGVSSWGLKSIIDRGVKTHEKPSGAKRIEDAENQTTKREIPGKQFKSYSMVGAFYW
ncbi:hypothetical protein LCGC14_0489650 [marine sediment metagenome]|uniref:Uncharacterized protein n=1 Tax=marine sediment metagenome TaxID=412755 RepID=A0A0F9S6X6_9ZZZZ